MKRRILAVLAGLAAFALVAASAATLGGVTVGGLGTDTADISACTDAGIAAAFTTVYDAGTASFLVDTVDLSVGDQGCDGTTVEVVLFAIDGGTNPQLGPTLTAVITGADASLTDVGIPAAAVAGIAVSIAG